MDSKPTEHRSLKDVYEILINEILYKIILRSVARNVKKYRVQTILITKSNEDNENEEDESDLYGPHGRLLQV